MFDMMEATRLESLHLFQDPATGLKAIIAIHNSRLGPALGAVATCPIRVRMPHCATPHAWPRA